MSWPRVLEKLIEFINEYNTFFENGDADLN